MSEKKLVCHSAICKCKYGDTPDELVVSTQKKNYINDAKGSKKLIATNKELGIPFKAKTFGLCKKQPAGSSYLACVPAITSWDGYFEKLQLNANKGYPILEDSKGTCSIAGSPCVEIIFHGQVAEVSSQNINNADEEILSQVLPMLNLIDIENPLKNSIAKFENEEDNKSTKTGIKISTSLG